MNENETPAKNTISIKKYAGVIESDPDKEIKDIESRLNQIRDFQEDPEHRQWIAEHGENICPFCDRVIPLTRFAIGKYKKRAKIPKFENSQLAQHLAEK
ncbi:MAG: hypothetical protein FWC61_03545, partial [Proteobacteria bacterium]|nr:hypothetical protein [Pseudomonadota bacterium]